MSLAEQAIRLKRSSWNKVGLQPLADELFLILTNGDPVNQTPLPNALSDPTGGSAQPPITPPPPLPSNTWPPLPTIDPIQFVFPGLVAPTIDPVDSNGQRTETIIYPRYYRYAVPGQVVTNNGNGTYAVNVYPFGGSASDLPNLPGQTVTELNGDSSASVGQWITVFWFITAEIKLVTVYKMPEHTIISQTTHTKQKRWLFEALLGGGGGGGAVPGVVKSGTGNTYTMTIYPTGLTPDPNNPGGFLGGMDVTATQLQIDSSDTIPPGSWALVAKVGASYFVQIATWL